MYYPPGQALRGGEHTATVSWAELVGLHLAADSESSEASIHIAFVNFPEVVSTLSALRVIGNIAFFRAPRWCPF